MRCGLGVGVGLGVAVGVPVGVDVAVGVPVGVGVIVGVGVGVGIAAGVYSSALATGKIKQQPASGTPSDQEGARSGSTGKEAFLLLSPAATRTMPLGSKVAVCQKRAVFRLPVTVQVPLAGAYSSALAKALKPLIPPATRTMPLESKVAV